MGHAGGGTVGNSAAEVVGMGGWSGGKTGAIGVAIAGAAVLHGRTDGQTAATRRGGGGGNRRETRGRRLVRRGRERSAGYASLRAAGPVLSKVCACRMARPRAATAARRRRIRKFFARLDSGNLAEPIKAGPSGVGVSRRAQALVVHLLSVVRQVSLPGTTAAEKMPVDANGRAGGCLGETRATRRQRSK